MKYIPLFVLLQPEARNFYWRTNIRDGILETAREYGDSVRSSMKKICPLICQIATYLLSGTVNRGLILSRRVSCVTMHFQSLSTRRHSHFAISDAVALYLN